MKFIASFYEKFPRSVYWMCRLTRANYESEMELLPLLCDPKKLSLDIGAKVGMYTYRLLKHSKEVWAFEPIAGLANLLVKVFPHRVNVENVALSNEVGKALIRIPHTPNGIPKYGRSTIEKQNRLNVGNLSMIRSFEVQRKRLDEYHLTEVGFIKIDVEGHELAVLEGAQETLKRCQPILLVEANDHHRPGAVETLKHFLGKLGYEGYFFEENHLVDIYYFNFRKCYRDITQQKEIENFIFIPSALSELKDKFEKNSAA